MVESGRKNTALKEATLALEAGFFFYLVYKKCMYIYLFLINYDQVSMIKYLFIKTPYKEIIDMRDKIVLLLVHNYK